MFSYCWHTDQHTLTHNLQFPDFLDFPVPTCSEFVRLPNSWIFCQTWIFFFHRCYYYQKRAIEKRNQTAWKSNAVWWHVEKCKEMKNSQESTIMWNYHSTSKIVPKSLCNILCYSLLQSNSLWLCVLLRWFGDLQFKGEWPMRRGMPTHDQSPHCKKIWKVVLYKRCQSQKRLMRQLTMTCKNRFNKPIYLCLWFWRRGSKLPYWLVEVDQTRLPVVTGINWRQIPGSIRQVRRVRFDHYTSGIWHPLLPTQDGGYSRRSYRGGVAAHLLIIILPPTSICYI